MNIGTLKYIQWTVNSLWVLATLGFVYVLTSALPNQKLNEQQFLQAKMAWVVFGFFLMASIGLKAYRSYLNGKTGKLSLIFQVAISVSAMFGALYIGWKL